MKPTCIAAAALAALTFTPLLQAHALTPIQIPIPAIESITPTHGPLGTEVTITIANENLLAQEGNSINLDEVRGVRKNLRRAKTYTLTIPATPCPEGEACDMAVTVGPGKHALTVTSGYGRTVTSPTGEPVSYPGPTSAPVYFTVTPTPPQPKDRPTEPPREPFPLFVEVRDAHTNAPVPGATVIVRGSKLFKAVLAANADGMVKTEVPAAVTVNHITIEAPEYRQALVEGSALRAILEGQSSVRLERVNPPLPPPYDPLRPPENEKVKGSRGFAPPGPPQGFWGRFKYFFFRLFNQSPVRY